VLGLVEGALGIMTLGGSLSALLGDAAIKAAAIVAVILSTLGLVMLLVADQTGWRRESESGRRLIAQYCNILMETRASYFKVVDWKQVMTVKSNGDLFSSITLRSVAVCEDLRFFRFRTGPAWGQSAKHRKGVTVQVRSVISGEIGGTRRDVTTTWLNDGRMEVLVHFSTPVPRGGEFHVVMEFFLVSQDMPFRDRIGMRLDVR